VLLASQGHGLHHLVRRVLLPPEVSFLQLRRQKTNHQTLLNCKLLHFTQFRRYRYFILNLGAGVAVVQGTLTGIIILVQTTNSSKETDHLGGLIMIGHRSEELVVEISEEILEIL